MDRSPLYQAAWMIFPVIFAGVAHMLVVSRGMFAFLARPVNTRLFGANKTYRGFVLMPVFSVLGLGVSGVLQKFFFGTSLYDSSGIIWLGTLLGLGYCLGELPNSYMKRRLGIAPGKSSERYFLLTFVTDHLDSLVGCLAVYALMLQVGWAALALCFVLGPAVHVAVNLILYGLQLRKEPL